MYCVDGRTFDDPTVSAVASIYKGCPTNDAPSRFGALYLNDWFVPSVVVDTDLRGIDFVFGAMSAVLREALDAIGGFEMLAGYLAEDFSMGRFVAPTLLVWQALEARRLLCAPRNAKSR